MQSNNSIASNDIKDYRVYDFKTFFSFLSKNLLKFSFTRKPLIHKWNSRKILAEAEEE